MMGILGLNYLNAVFIKDIRRVLNKELNPVHAQQIFERMQLESFIVEFKKVKLRVKK